MAELSYTLALCHADEVWLHLGDDALPILVMTS